MSTVGVDKYLEQKLVERRREYKKFGETVYLLEPNVKKSQGGLRDLHLLQWAGIARYQAPTIRELSDRGILARQDYAVVSEAREFLLRVRGLLHIHAGMAQEILSFDEHLWLAARFGLKEAVAAYEAGNPQLAAKEFRACGDKGDANCQFNLALMYEQ